MDPRPLPPQGVIAGLGSRRNAGFRLSPLDRSRQERTRLRRQTVGILRTGVGIARREDRQRPDKDEWLATIDTALASFDTTPYILQRFHKGKRLRQTYFDRESDEIRDLRRPRAALSVLFRDRRRRASRSAAFSRPSLPPTNG